MSNLQGQPGELRMTMQVTRKATGLTETVELVGKVSATDAESVEQAVKQMIEHGAIARKED